jgi:hypothetical protein
MRASVRLCTLLGILLALLPAAVAHADIAPVPKPSGNTGGAASEPRPIVAPVAKPKPVVRTPARPVRTQTAPIRPRTTPRTATLAIPRKVAPKKRPPVRSRGGRQGAVVPLISTGGHHHSVSVVTRIVRLMPTPLAIVGIDEGLPTNDSWPAWVLAAFSLLVSAEAFLLVRLARGRRYRRTQELVQLPDL